MIPMFNPKAKVEKGFFDEELRRDELSEFKGPLSYLNEIVDWEIFRPILEEAIPRKDQSKGGRRPFDHIFMFKILILQRTYNISDEQTEFQIKDRLSFQAFLQIGLADVVPDARTIWLFRDALGKTNAVRLLFERFDLYLHKRNLILNQGSIIDASFVDVPRQRNSRDENELLKKKNEVPVEWQAQPKKLAHKDVNARWTIKNRELHYGYKNHIKVDAGSKLITKYAVTAASKHDSQVLEELLDKKDEDQPLWADSAYCGEKQLEILKAHKIKSRVHERAYRGKPLTQEQKDSNREKSKIRVRVEHVFGFVENSMGGSWLKCIGEVRNSAHIGLMNLTYNICRFRQLLRCCM